MTHVADIKMKPREDDEIGYSTPSQVDSDDLNSSRRRCPADKLNRECQKRGFNSRFIVNKNADGMYQCLVHINGKDNSDRRSWPTPVLAKQEIAALALENNKHIYRT